MWSDVNGVARFCDVPLHAVDIVAGTYCGVVLVKGVNPTWPVTRNIFVTYESLCDELTFPDHCQVLLRIHDEEGHWRERGSTLGGPTELSAMCSGGFSADLNQVRVFGVV